MNNRYPKNYKRINQLNKQKSIILGSVFIALSMFACYLLSKDESMLLYIIACLYFIFIPVMDTRTRSAFILFQTAIMAGYIIFSERNMKIAIELIILQMIFMTLAWYQQNLMIRFHRMTNRLKKKTISSERDELTGLLNRRGLKNRIDLIWPGCIKHTTPIAILELDIDYFKQFNDAFGHPSGDKCLKLISKALRNSFVQEHAIITRTGGEEFLIFLKGVDQIKLVSIARRIRKNIEKLAIVQSCQKVSKYVTVSIGIVSAVPTAEDTFEQLYQKVDDELYKAKDSGRNCISYNGVVYGKSNYLFQKKNII